jgi:hypothetical protein
MGVVRLQDIAKPVSRPRSRKPATGSASALAPHLDCSRTYIDKLEAESVIQRQGEASRSTRAALPCDAARAAAITAREGRR